MIELARLIDPEARTLRKVAEEQDEIKQQAHAAISRARNALLGTSGYPDATFTLRLSFGTVKGYDVDGKHVPAYTTLGGAFEHAAAHGNKDPYELNNIVRDNNFAPIRAFLHTELERLEECHGRTCQEVSEKLPLTRAQQLKVRREKEKEQRERQHEREKREREAASRERERTHKK